MARPAKSVRVKSGAIAKEEAAARLDMEDKLRGAAEKPSPPENMPEDQREVFQFIVDALVESDILGKLDVFVLESTAVAVARLRRINRMVDRMTRSSRIPRSRVCGPNIKATCGEGAANCACRLKPEPRSGTWRPRLQRRPRTRCWRP